VWFAAISLAVLATNETWGYWNVLWVSVYFTNLGIFFHPHSQDWIFNSTCVFTLWWVIIYYICVTLWFECVNNLWFMQSCGLVYTCNVIEKPKQSQPISLFCTFWPLFFNLIVKKCLFCLSLFSSMKYGNMELQLILDIFLRSLRPLTKQFWWYAEVDCL